MTAFFGARRGSRRASIFLTTLISFAIYYAQIARACPCDVSFRNANLPFVHNWLYCFISQVHYVVLLACLKSPRPVNCYYSLSSDFNQQHQAIFKKVILVSAGIITASEFQFATSA